MIFIIDDERNIRRTLAMVIGGEGFDTEVAGSGEEGLTLIEKTGGVDAVFLDVLLPGINGLETLRRIKELDSQIEVIMISGHASVSDAVEATRLGAFDFLAKPLDRDRVLITLRNALAKRSLNIKIRDIGEQDDPYEMLGESEAIKSLAREIEKVAPSRGRVLILGESGTGKELVARAIHRLSTRNKAPFVKVNCAAIPAELIESELFGHERGSFSGALNRKRGKFELAHKGTLFLDEIADMSASAQAKVLRVLQTGEVSRVGSELPIQTDVRVLAATNRDLLFEVEKGEFREDLYFRLNVVPLTSPPLRERGEDIPLLAHAFIARFCKENGMKLKSIAAEAIEAMQAYRWPGNVRELKNICERLVIMGGDPITVPDLPDIMVPAHPLPGATSGISPGSVTLREFKEIAERGYIESTLRAYGWNVTRAAESLGIERTNLHKKMKSLGIQRDE
jgi:DNA-binding NtrC family response regulator